MKSFALDLFRQTDVLTSLVARISDTNSFVRSSALLALAAWVKFTPEFNEDMVSKKIV